MEYYSEKTEIKLKKIWTLVLTLSILALLLLPPLTIFQFHIQRIYQGVIGLNNVVDRVFLMQHDSELPVEPLRDMIYGLEDIPYVEKSRLEELGSFCEMIEENPYGVKFAIHAELRALQDGLLNKAWRSQKISAACGAFELLIIFFSIILLVYCYLPAAVSDLFPNLTDKVTI